ncbi:MAG: hypothetical protein J0H18_01905, partial [Rhizobiales bacterium]|nr:hypothetical protein [Hyphomicrobiales bacterium]
VAKLAEGDPAKFVMADSRERIGLFRNVCVKPNKRELDTVFSLGKELGESVSLLINGLATIGGNAFVTEGEDGICLYKLTDDSVVAVSIRGYPVSGPIDICGAGDSFMASFLTSRFFRDTDAEAALREAAVKAAATCMYPGGFPQPVLPIPDWLLTKYAGIIRQVEEV